MVAAPAPAEEPWPPSPPNGGTQQRAYFSEMLQYGLQPGDVVRRDCSVTGGRIVCRLRPRLELLGIT